MSVEDTWSVWCAELRRRAGMTVRDPGWMCRGGARRAISPFGSAATRRSRVLAGSVAYSRRIASSDHATSLMSCSLSGSGYAISASRCQAAQASICARIRSSPTGLRRKSSVAAAAARRASGSFSRSTERSTGDDSVRLMDAPPTVGRRVVPEPRAVAKSGRRIKLAGSL